MKRKATEEIEKEKPKLQKPAAKGIKKPIKATSVLDIKPGTSIQRESNGKIAAAIAACEAKTSNYEPAARSCVLDENYDEDEDEDGEMVEDGESAGLGEKAEEFKMTAGVVQSADGVEGMDVD
ncbi:hypothetical protein E2P81_ATG02866 [Venturia nashicola]|uniref:Uncharacterized protein n=1 Tax=Venturia nashicola TaxID=86259 RepID=A0A4Z1PM62_9PEZI|nr:hypothetical protein E6O75_ATG02930 [Venturia nashicola]TLD35977.1 hypothetical protein E2P81_ATG02866 [Venturia nashicola]